MRVLFKSECSDEVIVKMKKSGILPEGVAIKTEPETGRKYFNWIYRLSTNIEWEKLESYVEATSNLVKRYCDFVPEGIYPVTGKHMQIATIIVILKRNEASGVAWEEVEVYSEVPLSPQEISKVYNAFVTDWMREKDDHKILLLHKWSSGVPYQS